MDILPGSNEKSPRYLLYVLLTILTIACVVTTGIVLYHWKFGHDYSTPAINPLGLYTQRQGPVYWVLFPMVVLRLCCLIISVARSANSCNNLFRYVLLMIMVLMLASEIATCIVLFDERRGCNHAPSDTPSGSYNLCNDYRWCQVYGNYAVSFNSLSVIEPSCPLVIGTPLPPVLASDLSPNWVFEFTWASTFVFMILALLHVMLSSWMGNGTIAYTYGSYELETFNQVDSIDSTITSIQDNENSTNKVVHRKPKSPLAVDPFVINTKIN